ncbi:MAG: FAD-binding oxidoreductase [Geminicoccaceae bacterium]|nr:FAD-binding oxidoreductase [Geminicoccaceae bacterium]
MDYDVVVVGAGMAGASVAFELATDRRVLLLERETHPGYHTTGRSAAVYLKSYGNGVIRALTAASEAFFRRPPEGFTETALLHPRTALLIARADQAHRVHEELAAMRPFVHDARALTQDEILAMVPSLRRDYVAGGVLDPQAEDMDVHAILQGYLTGFKRRGGTLQTDTDLHAPRRTHTGWSIEWAGGAARAPVLVNAAGAWADMFASSAGVRPVGLQPKRRTAFIVDGPPDVDVMHWPVVSDIDEQFYFRPDGGRLFCSPADETPSEPCDAQPEEIDIAIAADRVMKALDVEIRTIRRSWAGLRTFAPDRTPVVGFDAVQGFFWLAGQGGYGIQTAPAMAVLAAASIRGEANDLVARSVVEAMSPARFRP